MGHIDVLWKFSDVHINTKALSLVLGLLFLYVFFRITVHVLRLLQSNVVGTGWHMELFTKENTNIFAVMSNLTVSCFGSFFSFPPLNLLAWMTMSLAVKAEHFDRADIKFPCLISLQSVQKLVCLGKCVCMTAEGSYSQDTCYRVLMSECQQGSF